MKIIYRKHKSFIIHKHYQRINSITFLMKVNAERQVIITWKHY